MSDKINPHPKMFISYSWTSPEHERKVLNLAEELFQNGIEIVFDKWDLKPGHDANAFMESMVVDPTVTKVLMICDEAYATKSNQRAGGAGTEAQIITAELYNKTKQDKFAAAIFEKDENGAPYIPAYLGSRIHFFMSDASEYSSAFEEILRWAWDKPKHVRPTKGRKPAFLEEVMEGQKISSTIQHRRALEALKSGSSTATAALKEYFNVIIDGMEGFRLSYASNSETAFDEDVVSSIADLIPYRNQLIEVFTTVSAYAPTEINLRTIHRFFENLLSFRETPRNVSRSSEIDCDNYKYFIHDLFLHLIAIFIKQEQFESANYFLINEYYCDDDRNEKMFSFINFRPYLKSFDMRNNRLSSNRISIHADMLVENNSGTGVDLKYLLAADFVLYIRGTTVESYQMWYPVTLLYSQRYNGAFEMFARAKSKKYFDKIKVILGVKNENELKDKISILNNDERYRIRWDFFHLDILALSGLASIATSE